MISVAPAGEPGPVGGLGPSTDRGSSAEEVSFHLRAILASFSSR